jgi:glycosyltransferase involved in cell wall biosynthesis
MAASDSSQAEKRLLIGAFACATDPSTTLFGGGDLMAWNLIQGLSQTYHLWVLTASQNQQAIEALLRHDPLPHVQFVYLDLPGWLHPLLKHQGGCQFYAYLWQWRAYFVARRLHEQVRFQAFHHLTYENDWMASVIGALLPVPYLRGPGGGAHRVPKKFRRQLPAGSYLWEYARIALQWVFRHDPFFAVGHERAKVLLMANHEAIASLPARWRKKAQLLSVNGISGHELAPPQQPARSDKFGVLSAGRLVPLKGFSLALRAFAIFAARHPEAEFTIIGKGPELSRLENLIRQLGIEKQARIESWMPRERLLARMRSCDVFLFASLRDGGGLVVVEAMASGKPVICFDLGGPGLHINPGCGFKVQARDPEQAVRDMAQALGELAADRKLYEQMAWAAFERARQLYAWDRVTRRIVAAYEKTMGDSV